MAKVCEICGRRPTSGSSIARRGLAKRKGGTGIKTTGVSKRWFRPNIQKIRVIVGNKVKRLRVCTRCIKKGLVQKPVYKQM
jgi:large subunit ribosomal protein L28